MATNDVPGYRPTADAQKARTDIYCHECAKTFIVELDFTREGNHVVECPYCKHEHFRVIKAGVISSDRWQPGLDRIVADSVWKTDGPVRVPGSTAAQFLRDSWLNITRDQP